MVLVGFSSSYWLILLLYFLTGIGSALSNVPIMALIAAWFDGRSRGRAAGLCVMGNGLRRFFGRTEWDVFYQLFTRGGFGGDRNCTEFAVAW